MYKTFNNDMLHHKRSLNWIANHKEMKRQTRHFNTTDRARRIGSNITVTSLRTDAWTAPNSRRLVFDFLWAVFCRSSGPGGLDTQRSWRSVAERSGFSDEERLFFAIKGGRRTGMAGCRCRGIFVSGKAGMAWQSPLCQIAYWWIT